MSALLKLQCGTRRCVEWPEWAVLVGQFEIAWLDRGDTTNGSFEPKLTNAARSSNVGFVFKDH
jgi:hypothetical protein